MCEELAEGKVPGIIDAFEEGRCCLVVPCAEGQAKEGFAVHAAHMSRREDGTSALPLDADVCNEGKDGEDCEKNDEAQHNVHETLDSSVEEALQGRFCSREDVGVATELALHRLVHCHDGLRKDVKHDALLATRVCNVFILFCRQYGWCTIDALCRGVF